MKTRGNVIVQMNLFLSKPTSNDKFRSTSFVSIRCPTEKLLVINRDYGRFSARILVIYLTGGENTTLPEVRLIQGKIYPLEVR